MFLSKNALNNRSRVAVLFIFLLTFQNVALISFKRKSSSSKKTKTDKKQEPQEKQAAQQQQQDEGAQEPQTTKKKTLMGSIKSKLGGATKKISKGKKKPTGIDLSKKPDKKSKKNIVPLKVRRKANNFKSWFSDRNPFWMSEQEKAHLADRYGRYYKPKYTYMKDGQVHHIMPETWKHRVAKQIFICFASMAAILKSILMTIHCQSLKAIIYGIKAVFAIYAMTQTCGYIKYIETTPKCKSAARFGIKATKVYSVVALKKTLKMSHVKIALTVGRSSLNNMIDKCIDDIKPNDVKVEMGPDGKEIP